MGCVCARAHVDGVRECVRRLCVSGCVRVLFVGVWRVCVCLGACERDFCVCGCVRVCELRKCGNCVGCMCVRECACVRKLRGCVCVRGFVYVRGACVRACVCAHARVWWVGVRVFARARGWVRARVRELRVRVRKLWGLWLPCRDHPMHYTLLMKCAEYPLDVS